MTPWDNLTYDDYVWAAALGREFSDALAWQTDPAVAAANRKDD